MVSTATSSEAASSSDQTTPTTINSMPLSSLTVSTELPNNVATASQKLKDDRVSSSTSKEGTKAPRRVSFTTLSTYAPTKQSMSTNSSTSSKGEQKDTDIIVIE